MSVAGPTAEILRVLGRHDVRYIVVGGVAAVLHGAPVMTFDLDILHSRSPENIDRLLAALRELDAHYRHDSRHLVPGASHVQGPGHQLLMTKFGPLDVLGSIEAGTTYEDVIDDSVEIDLGDLKVRLLKLQRLIAAKEHTGREKDLAVLPALRATLAEQKKTDGE